MISPQVSARKWAKEGPHQRQFDEKYSFDEERPITIFSEDDGGDIEQPDDDEGVGDAPAAPPLSPTAIAAAAQAKVAELIGGFPQRFSVPRDEDWSCSNEAVGKVVVREVNLAKSGTDPAEYKKTYAVCVAVRSVTGKNPFAPLEKEYRVHYGVRRRMHCGRFFTDPFELIDQKTFNEAQPQSDLDVATAKALREALDARRAAPPSSGAPASAPTEHPRITELRDYIRKRDGDPSLLDGWGFRPGGGQSYVQPVTGKRFQRKSVLELLGVGAATSRRTSTRETRTRAEAEDAEDARFAKMKSCVFREGFVCVSCGFKAEGREALEQHRAASHQDEPKDQRTPGEPCYYCRIRLEDYDWTPEGPEPLCQPGDAGPASCGNASRGRAQAFAIEQEMNRRRTADHYAARRPGPSATAPPKKPPKKKRRPNPKKR